MWGVSGTFWSDSSNRMAESEGEKSFSMEQLMREMMMAQVQDVPKRPPVLSELTLDGVVEKIKEIRQSENKKKIIVMTGAGISTAAGIPDFRSPGTGLYDNLQKYNLPNPQAVFNIGYFRQNPKPFFHLAKELYPTKFKPTISHYFIRVLEEEGLLLRVFTQNIDTLERRAGISDDVIVEAHGAFHLAHCVTCGKEYSHEFVKDCVFQDALPLCTVEGCAVVPDDELLGFQDYKGLVKPDIVFFGEALPDRFSKCAIKDLPDCKLLIILGTSLVVHPFASLVDRVDDDCPRLLINLEKVGQGHAILRMMGMGGGGLDFSTETGYRDVFLQGTCDDGCLSLAKALGLEEKLKELIEGEHQRLDSEISAMMASLSVSGKAEDKVAESSLQEEPIAPPTPIMVLPTTTYVDKPCCEQQDHDKEMV